jgi:hypothetical protein
MRGYSGVSEGAWLGFGIGESVGKAQIFLDEEVLAHKDQLVRFETEEAVKAFLVERCLAADKWPDIVQDLFPKRLDKNLL